MDQISLHMNDNVNALPDFFFGGTGERLEQRSGT